MTTEIPNSGISHPLDDVYASDRAFFEQYPRRHFRVRPAWDIEMKDFARRGLTLTPPAGMCWWIIIRKLARGVRARHPFVAAHDLPIDPPEGQAREVYQRLIDNDTSDAAAWLKSIPFNEGH
jgi:hypothetical protein